MKALAGFVMGGRSRAAMVAAAFALLSLIVPLASLVSAAAVGLVTLRRGALEGLGITLYAGLACAVLAYLAFGNPLPVIGFVTAIWLPVWVLGVVLRLSRSLSQTASLAALIGLVLVIGLHLVTDDPAVFWAELLEPVRQGLVEGGVLETAGSEEVIAGIARYMTGAFAAAFYLQVLLSLFIARWWQALLYNPGGFGEEYRALRVHPLIGIGSAGLVVLVVAGAGGTWLELLLLATPLLLLQGLAVVHAQAQAGRLHPAWLYGVYLSLVLAAPYGAMAVAGLGLADTLIDFRARWRPKAPRSDESSE